MWSVVRWQNFPGCDFSLWSFTQPGMFNFEDGFQNTAVRGFSIGAAEIAAANLAGQLILTITHTDSFDFIAFDYLTLETTSAVPEPAAIILLASGLLGLVRVRRKY